MKLIIPLLLTTSLFGQKAVYNDFSPTVKGITIGTYSCQFFFHDSVYSSALSAGWHFELACYNETTNTVLNFKKLGDTVDSGYEFPGGSIRYIIKPNVLAPTKYDISLSGKGPDDITDLPEIKLTI